MDQEALFQQLTARFEIVVRTIEVSPGEEVRLFAVRDTDVLLDQIDPEEFKRDERLPYWAEIWPAGIALARYLVTHPIGQEGRVMDLGCGLGLAGLAAAKRGAQVVMVDYVQDALAFARCSAGLNGVADRMMFQTVDWRCPNLEGTFRMILAADILYEPEDPIHIETFVERFLEPGGILLISDPDRKLGETFVARLQEKGYGYERTRMRVDFEGRLEQGAQTMMCMVNVHRLVKPDLSPTRDDRR